MQVRSIQTRAGKSSVETIFTARKQQAVEFLEFCFSRKRERQKGEKKGVDF